MATSQSRSAYHCITNLLIIDDKYNKMSRFVLNTVTLVLSDKSNNVYKIVIL